MKIGIVKPTTGRFLAAIGVGLGIATLTHALLKSRLPAHSVSGVFLGARPQRVSFVPESLARRPASVEPRAQAQIDVSVQILRDLAEVETAWPYYVFSMWPDHSGAVGYSTKASILDVVEATERGAAPTLQYLAIFKIRGSTPELIAEKASHSTPLVQTGEL